MGEAYRGLTIRIGADAQPLTRALSNINSAARKTSQQVGKISKALKNDPGNTKLIDTQIKALGDHSKATATQVALLSKSLKDGLHDFGKGGMKNLPFILKQAETEAANARTRFVNLDNALEEVYDSIMKYNVAVNGMSEKKATTALRAFQTEARNSKNEVEMLERELRRVWTADKSLIPFDTKNVDEAIAKWMELRKQHSLTQNELARWKKAAGIKADAIELEVLNSHLKETRLQAINAENAMQQMGASKGARNAAVQQRLVAEASKEAESALRSAMTVSKSLPKSFEAASIQARTFEQAVSLIEREMKLVKARLHSLDGSKVKEIESKFITASYAVKALTDRAATLDTKLHALNASKDVAKTENEIRQLNSEIATTEHRLSTVKSQLRDANAAHAFRQAESELAGLNGRLASTNALMMKANKKWGELGANLRTAGYSLMATAGAGATMAGMYAIQAAKDIDSAYRNMRKTVNGTEEQFEHLKDAALEFSQTHFTSADQILEIEAIGGQLGIQAQNLEKFAEVVSSIDIATNLDTETISQNLGQLANIMNDMDQGLQSGPGSMEAYGDALVRLGNNTAAQEDKIQNVMMRIASMGTICGMSTPDLLALASATAATGQGAEAAGTALSKTFSGIESAVNGSERALAKLRESGDLTEEEIEDLNDAIEAGNEKLQDFAEVAGMSAEDFKRAWNESPMDAFRAFIGGLQQIDAEGGSVDSTLTGLKITSVRQKQTLQGLTQTFDILGNAITMSNDAWNGVSDQWGAAGDAAREAQRKSEGFSGQLEMLKNNAKVLASEMLESLTPALSGAVGILRSITDGFKELPDEAKGAAVALVGVAAVSGPAFIAVGSTLSVVSRMKDFLGTTGTSAGRFADRMVSAGGKVETFAAKNLKAGGAVSKLGTGIGSLGIAMSSLPLSAVAAGIAVLGGVVVGSAMYIDSLTAKTKAAKEANKKLADSSKTLKDVMAKSFSDIGGSISSSLTISLDDALESYQTFAEEVASNKLDLSKSAEEMSTKILTIKGSVSDAVSIMERLNATGVLTELEFEQLSQSIDTYNQTTGDSIQLTKNEDGSIRVLRDGVELTADSFRDLAKAKEDVAKADYYQKHFNTNYENKIEAEKQVQALKKPYEEAKKAYESFIRSNPAPTPGDDPYGYATQEYNKQLAPLDDALNAASSAYHSATEELTNAGNATRFATEMLAVLNGEAAKTEGTFEHLVKNSDDVSAAFAATENSISDFKTILKTAGVSVDRLREKDLAEMVRDWDGSMPDLIESFEKFGLISYEAAKSLENLSLMTIDDKTYIVSDDGSIQWQEGQLQDLQDIAVDGKHYYITDDGTVYDQQGICEGFNSFTFEDKHYLVTNDGTLMSEQGFCTEFNAIVVNDKHYWVRDDGTILDQQGQLSVLQNYQLDGKTLYVTTDGLMTAEGELYTFDQLGLDPKEFVVDDDGTIRLTEDQLESLSHKIEEMPPSFTVTAVLDSASMNSGLSDIERRVRALDGRQINIISKVTELNATGGFKRMSRQRNVALHAAGAFITNGTTYIGSDKRGVSHIAGEAGREFVQHHADGTTSIIPIQNRKYMAPFVAAVADMLPEHGGVSREDLYKVADAVIRSNRQQGDIVLVLDDREIGRVVRRFAS